MWGVSPKKTFGNCCSQFVQAADCRCCILALKQHVRLTNNYNCSFPSRQVLWTCNFRAKSARRPRSPRSHVPVLLAWQFAMARTQSWHVERTLSEDRWYQTRNACRSSVQRSGWSVPCFDSRLVSLWTVILRLLATITQVCRLITNSMWVTAAQMIALAAFYRPTD